MDWKTLITVCFGGILPAEHKTYSTLKSVNNEFKCTISVLDQDVISNNVTWLNDTAYLSALKEKNIVLTDVGENVPDVKHLAWV